MRAVVGDVVRVRYGGIAQLAEHELCKLGVTGSNPVASTSLRFYPAGLWCGRKPDEAMSEARAKSGRVAQLVRAHP